MSDPLCPFCGAASPRNCDLEEELQGGECPWETILENEPTDVALTSSLFYSVKLEEVTR